MLEDDLRTWWRERPADQRSALAEAAADFRMDGEVLDLLAGSGCPLGSGDFKHGRKFLWPELLRRVVLEGAADMSH